MTTVASDVHGFTAPGLERVAQLFGDGRDDLGRGGAAFCVSHGGEVVVDVWCGDAAPDRPWGGDTVSAVFSVTKGLVATCLALLHDRGLLDPDEQVGTYWPGFSTDVTVRKMLSHQAGLIEVPGWSDLLRLDGTGWDRLPEIRRRLARAAPAWAPGSMHGYHVMTFGWLAGTLVELISGRPLARFFDEELAGPLGLDLRIGAPDAVVPRMATLLEPTRVPGPVGDAVEALLAVARDPQTLAGRACIAQDGGGCLDHLAVMGGSLVALRAGGGFGDGVGNARSVSAFYAAVLDGRAGISRRSVDTFRAR
ncbi:MAG TPA: serine hydrolase domain-containing protein, partial [Mycobacteriales bacterium]|nr:serine hydrolase domain-containing protein [Mycobacteriales bacterium]